MREAPRYQVFADIRHINRDFQVFFGISRQNTGFVSNYATAASLSNHFQCIIHYHSTIQRCVVCVAAHSAHKQNKLIWMKKH
jgi:hypothetical protein